MPLIKNVVIAGATGLVGRVVSKHMIDSGLFNVTILLRKGSSSSYDTSGSPSVSVVKVDFASRQDLEEVLRGQDAVVSALATTAAEAQIPLIEAASAVGVKRFLPSEYACKLDSPGTRENPMFASKARVEDLLIEKSKASSSLTYTFVLTSVFLDWGITNRFTIDLTTSTPRVIDGGNLKFSTTSLDTLGEAIIGVLNHPEETKNRVVQVHDRLTTQNELLDLARKAYPDRRWEPVSVSLDDLVKKAEENLAQGKLDQETAFSFLYQRIMAPGFGGAFEETDNELLGIQPKGDDFIIQTIKDFLE
ncbi:hypothetical protein F66182_4958 [Fusarium sp. NRRL 66182]|nr:hypothetical protein F66182_4958 [Fusarium sp. NRRL 66182]